MIKIFLTIIITLLTISCNRIEDPVTKEVLLDIPPRLQWRNDGGYCGSSTIQQISLYYGTYVSQSICRNIVNDEWVIVGINEDKVLKELSLEFDRWNTYQLIPQNKKYISWIKSNLQNNIPIMLCIYTPYGSNKWYDHIIPATGIKIVDGIEYLVVNNCYETYSTDLNLDEVINNRKASYNIDNYSIPKYFNFGCAITGVRDKNNETYPAQIKIENYIEPNISMDGKPEIFNGELKISSLIKGEEYIVLRYDDYNNVPENNFLNSDFISHEIFEAESELQSLDISFSSDSFVTFRCIKYNNQEI